MGRSKRARVPAHTNDVGFYALPSSTEWDRQYNSTFFGGYQTNDKEVTVSNIAFSLKSATLSGGVNRIPTEYVRKVSRIYSMGKVLFGCGDVPANYWTFSGDSSIHSRGLTLSASPFGDRVDSYTVNIDPDVVRRAITEVKNKVEDLKVNLLEDLAQAKSTVSLMADLYHLLRACWSWSRHGNYARMQYELNRAGYTVPERLSNAWLAWYYGIKPVLQTFSTLYDTLTGSKPQRPVEFKRTINYNLAPIDAFGPNANEIHASGVAYASSRASLVVQYSSNNISELARTVLGYSNVPALIWALRPYSFVFDWIMPVENWLKSVTFAKGLSVLQFYVNNNIYADCVGVATNPGVYPYPSFGNLPIARVKIAHTSRLIVNPYQPGLPYVQASLSPSRILSGAALLIQQKR